MKVLKYPLIPVTLFFAAGIITGYYLLPERDIIFLFTALVFTVLLFAYKRANRLLISNSFFGITALVFSFTMGLMVQNIHYAPLNKLHYSNFVEDTKPQLIKGVVAERLKPNDYNEKYFLDIISVNKKVTIGKVLLTVPKDSANNLLHAGDVLIVYDNFKPITPALNPYQFSYADYMKKQNVFHQLKLKDNYITAGQIHNFNYYTEAYRNKLADSFKQHNYSPATINVIKALLLGQRQDMDKAINEDYTNAGVIHILAISGLHIGILFAFAAFLLKPLERAGKKGKLLKLVFIIAFLWLFAILSGLSASVVRSVVMFSFVGVGIYLNRGRDIFNTIVVSILLLLLVKPNFIFDAGFQLSYAAVTAIVVLHPVFSKVLRSRYKALNYFNDLATISVAAQIGVLPLSLYYFNQFPLLFLLANILVIPLSTIALVTALITLCLNFICADAALMTGKLLDILITGMNGFIKWVASFKGFVIKNIPFTLLLNILLYAIIISFALWLYRKSYKHSIALLSTVALFQIAYFATIQAYNTTSELLVLHNYNNSLIVQKENNQAVFYTNDTLPLNNRNVIAYVKGNFIESIMVRPLQNTHWYNKNKILVIDSMGIYDIKVKPDILLLTQSPKVNLEKAISLLQPKTIVADATNYKSYIARWQETCRKQKIPFHATAEKGFYKVN
jgi:competence protein ComEC